MRTWIIIGCLLLACYDTQSAEAQPIHTPSLLPSVIPGAQLQPIVLKTESLRTVRPISLFTPTEQPAHPIPRYFQFDPAVVALVQVSAITLLTSFAVVLVGNLWAVFKKGSIGWGISALSVGTIFAVAACFLLFSLPATLICFGIAALYGAFGTYNIIAYVNHKKKQKEGLASLTITPWAKQLQQGPGFAGGVGLSGRF